MWKVCRRRYLIAAALVFAVPTVSFAQQLLGRVPRVGFLGDTPEPEANRTEAFREGLRERGWVEQQNILIEYRWWRGKPDHIPELVADLLRLKVDIILAPNSTAVAGTRKVTSTIPVVFANHADPVGVGHIASLHRPGGNITGSTMLLSEMAPKELELLKEMLPQSRRVGILWNPTTPSHPAALKTIEAAAQMLKLQLRLEEARNIDECDKALSMLSNDRVDSVLVLASPMSFASRGRLAELTLRYRLPTIFGFKENADAGGLASYGASMEHMYRLSATYVDRILKGARPADLPVQQPTKFEFVINLKTAKSLGLKIPQSILLRADQVIE